MQTLRTVVALLLLSPSYLFAQHVHQPGMKHGEDSASATAVATLPGQDAYAAIAEVVQILQADPSTDWSRVNIERLRQHLVDMSEVTLHSEVASTPIAGGLRMRVTGSGRTREAIRRMVGAHAPQLEAEGLSARVDTIAHGVDFTVTARDTSDSRRATELRGLGFIGIMTLGAHHTEHHLAIALGRRMGR